MAIEDKIKTSLEAFSIQTQGQNLKNGKHPGEYLKPVSIADIIVLPPNGVHPSGGLARVVDAPISDGKALARKYIDPPSEALMGGLDTVTRGQATPDRLTWAGAFLHLTGTVLQEQAHIDNHRLTKQEVGVIAILKGLGLYLDKADGNMADIFDIRHPGKHDRAKGQILDSTLDRKQEAASALLRARTAYLKGSFVGEMAAYAAALTAIMPSIERARIETLGFKPAETGESFWQSVGTRSRRAILTEVAGIRTIAGFNIQPGVDLIGATANINTARVRRRIYDKYKDVQLVPLADKKKEEARALTIEYANARLTEIEQVQSEIILATGVTFIVLRNLPFQPKIA